MTNLKLLLPLLILFCAGCSGNTGENSHGEGFSSEDKLKLQKYYVAGEQLFQIHCNNCHQNGKGLARLIPPLQNSDYFSDDSSKLVCAIKFGLRGSITVNGTEYNQPMPANPRLTNLEIATLTTFIYKEFQNQDKLLLPDEINSILDNCSDN